VLQFFADAMSPRRVTATDLYQANDALLAEVESGQPSAGAGRKPNYFKKDYASPLMKRPKPVTSCTHCRAPGYNIQLANGKCGRMVGTKRCTGTNQSAIGDNDWGECLPCAASGYDGAAQCRQCDRGSGWVFVRDSRL